MGISRIRSKALLVWLVISGAYAILEMFGLLSTLRQALIMPWWTVMSVFGVEPGASGTWCVVNALDVDVTGMLPEWVRMVAVMLMSGLVLRLWFLWGRRMAAIPSRDLRSSLLSAVCVSAVFCVFACIVIDRALFIAWEPEIPGEEKFGTMEHVGYALFCLFGLLWWITWPFAFLLAGLWSDVFRRPSKDAGQEVCSPAVRRSGG
jgi:hypothetical protein